MSVFINSKDIYEATYKMIGDRTPLLHKDCGSLCNGICCEGDEETGMYLYPFEEAMYPHKKSWYHVIESDFVYDQNRANILTCPGKCMRDERPLACRIFPLAPYQKTKEDKLKIIIDPRSFSLCPLSTNKLSHLIDKDFCNRVEKVFRYLKMFSPIQKFIEEMSYQMDDYRKFYR